MNRRRLLLAPLVPWVPPALLALAAGTVHAQAAAPRLPLRNLLVEVRQGEASRFEARGGGVEAGGVSVDSDGRVRGRADIGLGARSRDATGDAVQQLRVLNGGQAGLRVGASEPMQWLQWVWTPDGPAVAGGSQWVETGRSVVVQPSWPGGAAPVTVAIRSEASARAQGGMPSRWAPDGQPLPDGAIDQAGVLTTVQVPLGEWITVASSDDEGSTTERGSLSTRTLSRGRRQVLQLRVTAP